MISMMQDETLLSVVSLVKGNLIEMTITTGETIKFIVATYEFVTTISIIKILTTYYVI